MRTGQDRTPTAPGSRWRPEVGARLLSTEVPDRTNDHEGGKTLFEQAFNARPGRLLSGIAGLLREPRLLENTRRALRLNSRHQERSVVVLGAGAQLNRITATEERWLNDQVVVGLNRTTYVFPWIDYFVSAYAHEVQLALSSSSETTQVIHIHSSYRPPVVPGSLLIRRDMFDLEQRLPSKLSAFVPTILTRRNAALAATHLALVLGARGIVYVGVDMRSRLHFYDEDEGLRARMTEDLESHVPEYMFAFEHPYATKSKMVDRLRVPVSELVDGEFYGRDHTPTFEAYFAECRRQGVEVISTLEDSVVRDAGALFVPLSAFATSG